MMPVINLVILRWTALLHLIDSEIWFLLGLKAATSISHKLWHVSASKTLKEAASRSDLIVGHYLTIPKTILVQSQKALSSRAISQG
jgi:hypothetical protein